jgi:hypothetical protein
MAPGCTRAHTDQQTAKPQKRKQRAAHPPPGWRADGRLLHEHRHRRSKRIFACHLRCRGQHGAGEGGHRQQAHTHKHTTAVTKMMAGARQQQHHHHPTTRAPSQSSVSVNGTQTTRAVRKVARLRFVRERGAGWRAWRWGRGSDWQLARANHQAPPNRAGAHNLPCSGGSQVTWLPCLVCAKRGTMPEGGHPACRDREGDAATEATEATGGDGWGGCWYPGMMVGSWRAQKQVGDIVRNCSPNTVPNTVFVICAQITKTVFGGQARTDFCSDAEPTLRADPTKGVPRPTFCSILFAEQVRTDPGHIFRL